MAWRGLPPTAGVLALQQYCRLDALSSREKWGGAKRHVSHVERGWHVSGACNRRPYKDSTVGESPFLRNPTAKATACQTAGRFLVSPS